MSHKIRILRVYGQAVESRDFPGPHCNREVFQVPESEYRCPEWACKYALHHKIRSQESFELNEIEKLFREQCSEHHTPGATLYFKWKDLIKEAEKVALSENFDIVLCTCNEAASERITEYMRINPRESRFMQCIIDESGMAYEPETIVPMRLCEHVILLGDHKQLQPVIEYKPAKENGLTTSLFERYARAGKHLMMLNIQYRMVRTAQYVQ